MNPLLKQAIEAGNAELLRKEEEARIEYQKQKEIKDAQEAAAMESALKWVHEHLFKQIADAVSKKIYSITTYDYYQAKAAATIDGITYTSRQVRLSDDCGGLDTEYTIFWDNK